MRVSNKKSGLQLFHYPKKHSIIVKSVTKDKYLQKVIVIIS